jgi:hypothetical protein
MIIDVYVDENNVIEVKDAGLPRNKEFDVKIGDVTLKISAAKLTELYEKIEQAMWDESEWNSTLRDKVDELEDKVRRLEDKKECYMFT